MKKMMIVLTALFLVTAFVMPADAMRGGGKGHGYGFCNGNDLSGVQGLNLTAEQKTKITDLRTAHLKDIKPLQDKLHSKAGDLRLLWLEKSPDEAKIRATEKEVRVLRDQIQDKGTDYRWAVYKSLTAEQQERKLAIFDMLISLLERAYITAYSDHMNEAQRRRWNSWEDFMREWLRRDAFYDRLPQLLKGEDPEFVAYMRRLAEQERGGAPPH